MFCRKMFLIRGGNDLEKSLYFYSMFLVKEKNIVLEKIVCTKCTQKYLNDCNLNQYEIKA